MNPNKIIIDLPADDAWPNSTADLVRSRVQQTLDARGGIPGCTARITQEDAPLQRIYKTLLDMHMDTLMIHGPQVAQGLALAVSTIAKMYPEVQEDTP